MKKILFLFLFSPNFVSGQHLWINRNIGNKGFIDATQSSYGMGLWFNTNNKFRVGVHHNLGYIFETKGFKKPLKLNQGEFLINTYGNNPTSTFGYYYETRLSSFNAGISYNFHSKYDFYFMGGILNKTIDKSDYWLIEKTIRNSDESQFYWILLNNKRYRNIHGNYIFGFIYSNKRFSIGSNVELNRIQQPILRLTIGVEL